MKNYVNCDYAKFANVKHISRRDENKIKTWKRDRKYKKAVLPQGNRRMRQ